MALRIVGVDAPNVGGVSMPFQPNEIRVQDTTSQNIAQGDAAVTSSVDIVKQSTEVAAEAKLKTEQSNEQSAKGSGLVDVFNTTAKLIDRWNGIKQEEAKQKQKELEKLQEGTEAEVAVQLEQSLFGLRDALNEQGYQKGLLNSKQQVMELLKNPNLSPEARKELAQRAFRQFDDLEREFFRNAYEENKEIKRLQVSQLEFNTRKEVSEMLAAIGANAEFMTTEQRQQAIDQVEQVVVRNLNSTDLNPLQRAAYLTSMLKMIAESSEGSAKLREEVTARMNRAIAWQNEVAPVMALYENEQIGLDEFNNFMQVKNAQYGMPAGARPTGRIDALKEASERTQLELGLQKLQEENFLKNFDKTTLMEAEISSAALALLQDESQLAELERYPTIDNKKIIARYKQLKEQLPKVQQSRVRSQQLLSEMQATQAQIQLLQSYATLTPEQLAARKAAGINMPDPSQIGTLQVKLQNLQQEYQMVASSADNMFQSFRNMGVEFDQTTNRFQLNPAVAKELNNAKQILQSGQVQVPNFKQGAGNPGQKPPKAQLAKMNIKGKQVFVPVTGQYLNRLTFTSGFGSRVHPIKGTRKHHDGIDLAAPIGTPTVSIRSGTVIFAGKKGGYGNVVVVRQSDGKEVMFAHLDKIKVKKGQGVAQGEVVGTIGNTGLSTGPHLHLSVFNGPDDKYGIDPVAYLATVTPEKGTTTARGLGLPPAQGPGGRTVAQPGQGVAQSQVPAGALLLPLGGYIWNGKVYRPANWSQGGGYSDVGDANKQINRARPMPGTRASNRLEDYPKKNDPNANYGYKVIAQDPKFARALAATADRIGIPAQWLADVMAFETGGTFDPSIENKGHGAVGLIQFYPDTKGGTTRRWVNGRILDLNQVRRMSRVQQLRLVEEYFKAGIQEVGKFKRMDDVFAFVWGGGNLVRKKDSQRVGQSDGDILYQNYLERIGEHAGRSYAHGLHRGASKGSTHTRYHSNCQTCNHMQQTQGKITPHKG